MTTRIIALVLVACAAVSYLEYRRAAPAYAQPAPIAAAAPAPLTSSDPRTAWAVDLAERLGNPAPDAATIGLIVAWTNAEDRSDGALNRFNPLNTTEASGAVQTINGDGVRGYSSYEDGMQATVRTLQYDYPGYSEIVAGLQSNDPERALRGLYASPWGTSAATTEAVWRSESVIMPELQATSAPDCPVDPCWQSGSGYSPGHPGVDLGATLGQSVYATQDGTVHTSVTWPCGNGVSVTNGATMALMCHLSGFAVEDGAQVVAGAVVGYAGSSGLSTGPHVHFEIRVGGVNVDPSGVLR